MNTVLARQAPVARPTPKAQAKPAFPRFTAEEARIAYVAARRLDLRSLAECFEGAPDDVEVSGKLPPQK